MEKIDLFFCDITKTITSSNEDSWNYRKEYLKHFCNDLIHIAKEDKVSRILFSFVTDDRDLYFVQEYIKEFESTASEVNAEYGESVIMFGKHYFELGYIKGEKIEMMDSMSKVSKMSLEMEQLKNQYDIEHVFYADDEADYTIPHDDYSQLKQVVSSKVSVLVPGGLIDACLDEVVISKEKGIIGVCQCLEDLYPLLDCCVSIPEQVVSDVSSV